jgi:hypothetical protein
MDSYFPFIAYHQFEDSKGASRSCQSKKGWHRMSRDRSKRQTTDWKNTTHTS